MFANGLADRSPAWLLLQRPPDRIFAGPISLGVSEHFWVGIQMAGEIALAALPAEFPVKSLDELLEGSSQECCAGPPLSNQSF